MEDENSMNEVHFPSGLGCDPIGKVSVLECDGISVRRYYFLKEELNGSSPMLFQIGLVRDSLRPKDLAPQFEVEVILGLPSEVFIG